MALGGTRRYGSQRMHRYRDSTVDPVARSKDLVGRLSLAEKIGQLNIPCPLVLGDNADTRELRCQEWAAGRPPRSIGEVSQVGGFFSYLEYAGTSIAVEESPHGIPLLFIDEGTHGLRAPGAPIYPEGLAVGSTWNPALLEEVYKQIAETARSVGIHGLATLVVEPFRDPRIGRNQECFSEDRLICADLAEAVTRGLQSTATLSDTSIIAVLSHFPGQSAGSGGLERGPMPFSERTVRDVFLPPWRRGISFAGAAGAMATYASIDGVPAHSSKRYLDDLLRGELGFSGLVFSEGAGLESLIYEGVAATQKEAGVAALLAGLDVSIWFESGFWEDLFRVAQEDDLITARIDRSVARILETKFRLGLFETFQRNKTSPKPTVSISPTTIEVNEKLASQGIVLLKNERDLLPLGSSVRSVAVIGPNADDRHNLLGDYTTKRPTQEIVTVLDGILRYAPQSTVVRYEHGCGVIEDDSDDIDAAVTVARESDIAIVVVGENGWRSPQLRDTAGHTPNGPAQRPTNGEGYDAATLSLTGRQSELVMRVAETGTPVVLLLINGRPLAIPEEVAASTAVVECWIPGERGGAAAASIIFGHREPTGRLSVTIPRHAGQLPIHYDQPKSREFWVNHGWLNAAYVDISAEPLFDFGFGLGYTTYRLFDLSVNVASAVESPVGYRTPIVRAGVEVQNSGPRKGTTVVQFYQRDLVSSVSTPAKRLAAYARVTLAAGETARCEVDIPAEAFSLVTSDNRTLIEAGEFEITVGLCSRVVHDQEKITLPSMDLESTWK